MRPARPFIPHFLEICDFTGLMHDTVFISDFTQLASSRYESSYHLLLLIADQSRNSIDQDSFFVVYQRDSTELRDQRLLSIRAFQACLEAFPWTVWGLSDGSIPLDHLGDGTVIFGCQGVQEGLLRCPLNAMEPVHIVG